MTAPAAVAGTFADFRTVKGRKVCQIIVEVPIEHATAAINALGGVPQPTDPKWVAIARLIDGASSNGKASASKTEDAGLTQATSAKRRWDDLPVAQQSAIRCSEERFQRFLRAKSLPVTDEKSAADVVRTLCRVESRRDLNTNATAAAKWREIDSDFRAWMMEVA